MDDDLLEAWSVIDLVTPVVVRIAATIGLLRRVASEPVPVPRLAYELELDEDVLRRLVRLLGVRGVLRLAADDAVEATRVGRILSDGPTGPFSTRLDWSGAAGELDRIVVRDLLDAVRGAPNGGLWERLDRDQEFSRSFDELMTARAPEWIVPVTRQPFWRDVRRVVDLGGGWGHLLVALLDAWPHLHGTLVERPAVITELAASGPPNADRLRLAPGDFFGELPIGGDAYLLAHVLHDWNDEQAARILTSAARAAGPSGRVMIIERVVPESSGPAGPEPARAAMLETAIQDLRMFTLFGGGERTESQFRALGAGADLTLTDAIPLAGHRHLLTFTPTCQN